MATTTITRYIADITIQQIEQRIKSALHNHSIQNDYPFAESLEGGVWETDVQIREIEMPEDAHLHVLGYTQKSTHSLICEMRDIEQSLEEEIAAWFDSWEELRGVTFQVNCHKED
jgi:hypothetical protein